jgi:hypothetical protein
VTCSASSGSRIRARDRLREMGGAGSAEEANQHPDVVIGRNRVARRWWTHAAGAITDRDIELAALQTVSSNRAGKLDLSRHDAVHFGAGSAWVMRNGERLPV